MPESAPGGDPDRLVVDCKRERTRNILPSDRRAAFPHITHSACLGIELADRIRQAISLRPSGGLVSIEHFVPSLGGECAPRAASDGPRGVVSVEPRR
jgi:hypothetical protein